MRGWTKTAAGLSLVLLVSVTAVARTGEPAGAVGAPKGEQEIRPSEALELVPGKPIEREMKGGEAHSYRITVAAGQYVHVVVDQRGIDVVLVLYGPDGHKLLEMDSPNGTQVPEAASLVAQGSGTYRVGVRSLENDAPPGRYEVRVEPLRLATRQDKSRVAAERSFAEAAILKAQGTADGPRRAIVKYEEALGLWRGLKDRLRESYTLEYIGNTYMDLGDRKKALDYYNQALPTSRAAGDRSGEAVTLDNIGRVYNALGERQKALDYLNQALPIQRTVGDRFGEAHTLSNIGWAYAALGEKQKALDYYSQALPIHRAVGDHSGEAHTLGDIAFIQRDLGDLVEARALIEEALRIIDSLRTKIASQGLRASYFSSVQRYYQFYIDLLMRMHEQHSSEGLDGLALGASERARAQR